MCRSCHAEHVPGHDRWCQGAFQAHSRCVAETRQTQAFWRHHVHSEARHRRFDGLKIDLEWLIKLDGPERTATIKPVFSQNEMVVDFDYCIIAPGATSVLFASGAGHCSEFATRDAKRSPRSCHENILRHPVNEGVPRCIWAVQRILPFHEFQENLDEYMLLENGLVPHLFPLFEYHDSNIWRRVSRHIRFRGWPCAFDPGPLVYDLKKFPNLRLQISLRCFTTVIILMDLDLEPWIVFVRRPSGNCSGVIIVFG